MEIRLDEWNVFIKDEQLKACLNTKEFSKLCGVSARTLKRWKDGEIQPRFNKTICILNDLGYELFIDDNVINPSTLSGWIKGQFKSSNLSIYDFSSKIGISECYLYIVASRKSVAPATLQYIADSLNLKVEVKNDESTKRTY